MTTAAKAVAEGRVGVDVFPIEGEVPKVPRKTGYRRTSEIEDTLAVVAEEYPAGVNVAIRQYKNKESANGTLYNLRKRHTDDGWEFEIGDGTPFGLEGITVLFARHS
jgi:hypothetical protein